MASVHRVRGLFPSALHYLDKQVLTEQLHTNPLGEILYNVPRAADKWNSYATWEYKRLYAHKHPGFLSHTLTQRHGHTEWGATHWKLDKAKKSDDNNRNWDKENDVRGRKMVSEDVKVIDVSLDTDVCLSLRWNHFARLQEAQDYRMGNYSTQTYAQYMWPWSKYLIKKNESIQ